MRWPFGPPHLTLKPSKKTPKTKKKKTKKQQEKRSPPKKQQKYQKIAFQLSVTFFFFGWLLKISFFDTLAQKALTPKTL